MELTDEMRSSVTVEERFATGPAGAPDVRVLLYRPTGATGTLPLVGREDCSDMPLVCTRTPSASKDAIVPAKEFCLPMKPATNDDSGES